MNRRKKGEDAAAILSLVLADQGRLHEETEAVVPDTGAP